MSLEYTPTTELEAVNNMLLLIGEQPIQNLETSGVSEASLARRLLHTVSRNVQVKGLDCNSEENYPLSIDENNEIVLPANTLKIDSHYKSEQYVRRGNKLYNKQTHTFKFTGTVYVDIVFFLPYEDLPEAVRAYIYIKAGRQFQTDVLGSDTLAKLTAYDEQAAWLELFREEIDSTDVNIFNSYDQFKIINRRV
jgi:hypothetical protein